MELLDWALDKYKRDLANGYKLGEGSAMLAERRAQRDREHNLTVADAMLNRVAIARFMRGRFAA